MRRFRNGSAAVAGENPLMLKPALLDAQDPAYAHISTVEDARNAVDGFYLCFQEACIECTTGELSMALINMLPSKVRPNFILYGLA